MDKKHRLDELRKQCTELKCLINSTSEENLRNRTRLMALTKEKNKRDRLLQTMVRLNHEGLGLGPEIIDKLREEYTIMLPLYRKKAQDLQQQILEREKDHKAMKRELDFTRIIELQVEFVSWKQESRRLESMMKQDPEAVSKEAEMQEKRVKQLSQELAEIKRQLVRAQDELTGEQEGHQSAKELFEEKAEELARVQSETKDITIECKQLIQDRKEAEHLQTEINEMELDRKQDQEELEGLQARLVTAPSDAPDRYTVTGVALSAAPAKKSIGLALLRRASRRESPQPLMRCLCAADRDQDGLLNLQELIEAMAQWHGCPLEPSEAARLLFRLASRVSEDTGRIRWLDAMVLLDGLGPSSWDELLPDLLVLRWACLRARLYSEELLRQLGVIDSKSKAEAFFGGAALEMPPSEASQWVEAWQKHGSERLMLLLPLGEATLSSKEMNAWLCRLKTAVQNNREELQKAFVVWRADMLMTPEQFRMVCGDVLGLDLSEEDIEDVLLFSCSNCPTTSGVREAVDGRKLLDLFS